MVKKRLSDISKISGGQITSRLEKKEIDDLFEIVEESDKPKITREAFVLVPRAISNSFVDKSSLMKIVCEKETKKEVDAAGLTAFVSEDKITKANTLVLKLSSPYDACIITKNDENLIVSSFCATLTITDKNVSLLYVLAFLNSKLYQDQIKDHAAGSAIPLISVGAIENVQIPLPSKEEQEKIGKDFINTMKKIKLINKVISLESEKINSIFYGMEG
ncbi:MULTISPECIES: restriction endonuclease subunit S [unclassified Fibrobacter]|uniref:restriction endonuclease subunit S n=1 Tax=unclassified Fibrobacter TaxID=2634177 RepID=UPI000D6AF6DB|nr:MULTISPECIES: restriction endonuclease subunit S [unclassified Fibrobacter]PWJ59716.1 type I restriction modification DNA specificity protein [Fibrobacter sp. UWR4]PZW65569.1 type I restriction modification DNA specificity protein [Fibrobacter sp. UWR1]